MKKLFLIFFALALMLPISTQAQKSLLTTVREQNEALQDATEMLTSSITNGPRRVSPRANVPYDQATLDVNWAWSNLTSTQKMAGSTQVVQEFKWRDSDGDFVSIIMLLNKSSLVTRGGKTFIANGTYNVTQSSASANYIAGGNGWNFGSGKVYKSSAQCGPNTGIYINSGTMIVENGADGNPFVVMEFVVDFSASRNRYSAYFTAGLPIVENLTETWTNAELVNSTTTINWADYGYDTEYIQRIEWYRDGVSGRRPCIRLEVDMFPEQTQYYNNKMMPAFGSYNFNTDGNNISATDILAYPVNDGSDYMYSFWYSTDNVKRYLKAGTMQVVKGIAGPCLKINATGSKNSRFNNSTYTLTIGTPAYTITFNNQDGTQLQSSDWAEGSTPSYSGSTPTKPDDASYTYTFSGWSPSITAATADKTYTAQFSASPKSCTYEVAYNAHGGSGTMTNQEFTCGVAQNLNPNTFTGPAATITYNYHGATSGNSTPSVTVYKPFGVWEDSEEESLWDDEEEVDFSVSNGATVTMTAQWDAFPSVTLPTPARTGYTFNGWYTEETGGTKKGNGGANFVPTGSITLHAQWTANTYNITYESLNDATNNNPATYTIETPMITLVNPGELDGYNFTGWTINGEPITEIPTGSYGDLTITANWEEAPTVINLILQESENDEYYDDFQKYNGVKTTTVTLNRQFKTGVWSTLCLPFDVNSALMTYLKMKGRVYEFKYATGNADLGDGLNLYFAQAKSIKAGIPYIVNANESLASKTSFVFPSVTINTTADSVPTLASLDDYDRLGGHKSSGTIELVGTHRNGILKGTETGNTYMGLKANKIYYPNIENGSTIWAYRSVFRSTKPLNVQKIKLITEDIVTELEIVNDELVEKSNTTKFVKDGVLYIKYNDEVYNALGQRIYSVR